MNLVPFHKIVGERNPLTFLFWGGFTLCPLKVAPSKILSRLCRHVTTSNVLHITITTDKISRTTPLDTTNTLTNTKSPLILTHHGIFTAQHLTTRPKHTSRDHTRIAQCGSQLTVLSSGSASADWWRDSDTENAPGGGKALGNREVGAGRSRGLSPASFHWRKVITRRRARPVTSLVFTIDRAAPARWRPFVEIESRVVQRADASTVGVHRSGVEQWSGVEFWS